MKHMKHINTYKIFENKTNTLFNAIKQGNYDIAYKLINNGIDINSKVDGHNTFYYAINKSIEEGINEEFLFFLLEKNIEIETDTFFLLLYVYVSHKPKIDIKILYKIIDDGFDLLYKKYKNMNFWEYLIDYNNFHSHKLLDDIKQKYLEKYEKYEKYLLKNKYKI